MTIGHVSVNNCVKQVEKYSVLQVSDDNGKTWLDFSTLRDPDEVHIAVVMVNNRGGIRGHRVADYRIMQNGDVLYERTDTIAAGGMMFNIGDRLEVLRLHGDEDEDEGWVLARQIVTLADAKTAIERCGRLREEDDSRYHRVTTAEGQLKLTQPTVNSYRMSGIIWVRDPLNYAVTMDLPPGAYDRHAALLEAARDDWDGRGKELLDELHADEELRVQLTSYISLSW